MSRIYSELPVFKHAGKILAKSRRVEKLVNQIREIFFNILGRLGASLIVTFRPGTRSTVYTLVPGSDHVVLVKFNVDVDNKGVLITSRISGIGLDRFQEGSTSLEIVLNKMGPGRTSGTLELHFSGDVIDFIPPISILGLELRLVSPIDRDEILHEISNMINDALMEVRNKFQIGDQLLARVWNMMMQGKIDLLHIFEILDRVLDLYISAYSRLLNRLREIQTILDLLM